MIGEKNRSKTKKEANQLPVLTLAYIGDAVYELVVRSKLLCQHKRVDELHKNTVEKVRAESQAEFLDRIKPYLEKDEDSIVRRTRNTKLNGCPKNVDISTYRKATALEALIGYLYLTGERDRITSLINRE